MSPRQVVAAVREASAKTVKSGLSDGVAAPVGVPLLDCAWLAAGVISVPTSCIDSDGDCDCGAADALRSFVRRGS